MAAFQKVAQGVLIARAVRFQEKILAIRLIYDRLGGGPHRILIHIWR